MIFRPAQAADLHEIKRIAEAAFSVFIAAIGKRPAPMDAPFSVHLEAGALYVVEHQKTRLGYAIAFSRGASLHIDTIAVDPDAQGRGVGRRIMAELELIARDEALEQIDLYTNIAMQDALALYPKLGFVEVERRTEAGFARAFFVKKLTGSDSA